MRHYTSEELSLKLKYYKSLPEKARRHYLALEYRQLGRGSQHYLSSVFSCGRQTIIRGCKELDSDSDSVFDYTRQRKSGGGRKKKSTQ